MQTASHPVIFTPRRFPIPLGLHFHFLFCSVWLMSSTAALSPVVSSLSVVLSFCCRKDCSYGGIKLIQVKISITSMKENGKIIGPYY